MKKLYLLLFPLFLFSAPTWGQKVTFTPKWKKGDTFKYFYFKNKYNPKNTAYKQDQDTVVLDFNVVSAAKDGYTIALRYDYSKSLPPLYPPAGLGKVAEVVKQTKIELTLDGTGKYVEIKNWQELKKRCEAELEEGKKLATESEKGTWDYWRTKVQTQAQIEKMFAEDIEFFFMLYGSSFVNNSKFEYEDEIKSPYGKDMLPANTELEAKTDAENPALIEVKLFTLPDAQKAAAELKQYREAARQQEDDPKAIPDADLFDLQDYYVFLNNTQTGTHQTAMYLRYLKTGSKELIESYKFILIP